MPLRQEGTHWDIGDEAVANGGEGFIGDNDSACRLSDHQDGPAVDQPTGQRSHKGRDAQLGYQESGDQSGHDAQRHGHGNDDPHRQVPLHHADGGDGAQETSQEAYRKVNVPDHNHQGHTDCQNSDITGLVDQVNNITRRYKRALGRDRENNHDGEQGNEHAVFADVFTQHPGDIGKK